MSLAHDNQDQAPLKQNWFVTTHWTVVLTAGDQAAPQAAEALEQLCRVYWYPLYAYVRRQGYSPEDAQDFTQAFFARFLEKNYLAQVDREKGRFRSFLLASLRHFLADERDRARAAKRGGGQTLLSLDAQEAEGRYSREPVDEMSAEKIFDRRWALTVLESVLSTLRHEFSSSAKAERFLVLETFLPGQHATLTYAEAATRLGVPIGTAKWEVHQIKRRYRELLRAGIAHTVASPDQIDNEVKHLIAVLSG